MSNYNCNKCGFSTRDKSQYNRHLKTKKHLHFENNIYATQCNPNATQMQPNATQMQPKCNPNAT